VLSPHYFESQNTIILDQQFECAETEIQTVIDSLLGLSSSFSIFCFSGDLGAGKTTLIRALCRQLGFNGKVSSPTYGLVNEYKLDNGKILFHSDWYRIEDANELVEAGIADNLHHSDGIWLIEWPEIGMEFVESTPHIQVQISHKEYSRIYAINAKRG